MSISLFEKLNDWVDQRPQLDYRNYSTLTDYRRDQRRITRQLHHARLLISETQRCINEPDLRLALKIAYSGRLSLGENNELIYCAGQYWPIEYRASVCAVCAYALCSHWRLAHPYWQDKDIIRHAKRAFGRGVAEAWF